MIALIELWSSRVIGRTLKWLKIKTLKKKLDQMASKKNKEIITLINTNEELAPYIHEEYEKLLRKLKLCPEEHNFFGIIFDAAAPTIDDI